MENSEKEAINRANQAISPAGLGDRSDKATASPDNDSPDDSPLEGMDSNLADDQDDIQLTTNTD